MGLAWSALLPGMTNHVGLLPPRELSPCPLSSRGESAIPHPTHPLGFAENSCGMASNNSRSSSGPRLDLELAMQYDSIAHDGRVVIEGTALLSHD